MPGTRVEWPEGRGLAAELSKRHPELLKDVPPLSDILFVLDTENKPMSKGNAVLARVSKVPTKFEDFVYYGYKTWMLEWFIANNSNLTPNQKKLLMIHELLHFEVNDKGEHRLRGHDLEDFYVIVECFGPRWSAETRGDVPDVMSPGFTWGRVGQARLEVVADKSEPAQEIAAAQDQPDDSPPADPSEASDPAADTASGQPDGWQPEKPFVPPDNVRQLRPAAPESKDAVTAN